MPLIKRCLCGSTDFTKMEIHNVKCRKCIPCGIIHQIVDLDEEGYAKWYEEQYHNGVYGHSYEHDYAVGVRRIARYGVNLIPPILDVGCGNGGFVDACNNVDLFAEGQDLGGSKAMYLGPLDKNAYRHAPYKTITMHDVLEHFPDPSKALSVVHGLLDKDGVLIVDFPAFFSPCGVHHWKPVEHLWMLTDGDLIRLIEESGYQVFKLDRPIPSKTVVYAKKSVSMQ